MIGTVLVPLDGSALAEEALPYARTIAERSNAPLHLVRVIPPDAPASEEETAREYLRSVIRARDGLRLQISIRMGDPAEQIIAAAEELIDPIIAMTTRGRSGIGRWLYGSVADRVVRGAGLPVFLIRSGMTRAEPAALRAIMVPLDGSVYAEAALPYAEQVARVFDAEVRLVRVAETAQVYAMLTREPMAPTAVDTLNDLGDQLVRESREYLARVEGQLREKGIRARAETLEGFAADQLLAYERETQPDLVVMATHGRSGLGRLVFGSVAERILRLGSVPVMMIQPKGAIETEPEASS